MNSPKGSQQPISFSRAAALDATTCKDGHLDDTLLRRPRTCSTIWDVSWGHPSTNHGGRYGEGPLPNQCSAVVPLGTGGMCSTRLATKIVVKMLTGRSREWLLYIIIFAFSSRLISVRRPLLGTGPLMIPPAWGIPLFLASPKVFSAEPALPMGPCTGTAHSVACGLHGAGVSLRCRRCPMSQ